MLPLWKISKDGGLWQFVVTGADESSPKYRGEIAKLARCKRSSETVMDDQFTSVYMALSTEHEVQVDGDLTVRDWCVHRSQLELLIKDVSCVMLTTHRRLNCGVPKCDVRFDYEDRKIRLQVFTDVASLMRTYLTPFVTPSRHSCLC